MKNTKKNLLNILLLNPPFLWEYGKYSREQRSPAITKSGTLYYPMWLCYAAGVLEENGFSVSVIDAPAKRCNLGTVLAEVSRVRPSLAVIDASTPSIYNDAEVGTRIKDLFPDVFLVLVGPHVSACAQESLECSPAIDAVARKEYEYTILDLARLLRKENRPRCKELERIDGLSFRADGKIFHTPDRGFLTDLDQLPFAAKVYKKHLNYKDYFYSGNLYPVVTLIMGRGCPFRCPFCVYPQTFSGRGYRFRSIDNVIEEVEYVIKSFRPLGEIMFEDDTLTAKKRCIEFSETILRKGLRFTWSANSRVELDYEAMKIMKRAGCRSLLVGFESGNQKILNNMRKGTTLEKSINFTEAAGKAGILINGAFMVGNEGETKETMQETLEFAKRLNPDVAQFFPIMVYPGTELYDFYYSKGYVRARSYRDWLTEEGLHNCVVNMAHLSSDDMVSFCDNARRQFYLRPRYIFYKGLQAIRCLEEGKRTVKSAKTFLKYLFKGSQVGK